MPPEMPTDIQRLIARMMEAGVSAEEAIPTMANGGILDLLKEAGGRGVRRAVNPIGHAMDVARDVPEALESLGGFDPHKYFGSRTLEPDSTSSGPQYLRNLRDRVGARSGLTKRRGASAEGFKSRTRDRLMEAIEEQGLSQGIWTPNEKFDPVDPKGGRYPGDSPTGWFAHMYPGRDSKYPYHDPKGLADERHSTQARNVLENIMDWSPEYGRARGGIVGLQRGGGVLGNIMDWSPEYGGGQDRRREQAADDLADIVSGLQRSTGRDALERAGIKRPKPPLPSAFADLLMQPRAERTIAQQGEKAAEELEDIVTSARIGERLLGQVPRRELSPELSRIEMDQEAMDLIPTSMVARRELTPSIDKFEIDPARLADITASVIGESAEDPDEWRGIPYRLPVTGEESAKRDVLKDIGAWRPDYGGEPDRGERGGTSEVEGLMALRRMLMPDIGGFEIGQEGSWDPRTAELERLRPDASSPMNVDAAVAPGESILDDQSNPLPTDVMYPTGPTWEEVQLMVPFKRMDHIRRWHRYKNGLVGPWSALQGKAYGGIIGLAAGGDPYQQRMVQSYVSPEVAQPYADLVGRIGQVGAQPYTPYKGQRLAATGPEQAAARAAYYQYGTGEGPAGTRQAARTFADTASQYAQTAQDVASPEMQKDANLQDYMSQYTQGVIDPQTRQIRQQGQIQMSELGSRAGAAGAFGGYRHGLEEQGIGQSVAQQTADVTAKGQEQAFQDAVKRFESDRAAQAAGRGQQLSALGGITDIGRAQASLGGQQQQQQLQRLQAMEQAGARTQQEQQRDYDIAYEDFQRQQRHPQEQTQWQLEAMSRLPYQNTQVIGDYGTDPGLMADAAGAMAAHKEYQSDQDQAPRFDHPAPVGDPTIELDNPMAGVTDEATSTLEEAGTMGPSAGDYDLEEGTPPGATTAPELPDPTASLAGGGYIGSSGILAPYHKKLLDGLYAGGRIAY